MGTLSPPEMHLNWPYCRSCPLSAPWGPPCTLVPSSQGLLLREPANSPSLGSVLQKLSSQLTCDEIFTDIPVQTAADCTFIMEGCPHPCLSYLHQLGVPPRCPFCSLTLPWGLAPHYADPPGLGSLFFPSLSLACRSVGHCRRAGQAGAAHTIFLPHPKGSSD